MTKEILKKIYNVDKNLIITGDLNAKKTKGLMFPLLEEMINNQESLLIVDSKEEYLQSYQHYLKENKYNLIIINLKNPSQSDGFNPLEHPYRLFLANSSKPPKEKTIDSSLNYLEQLANIIFADSLLTDPIYTSLAKEFFVALCLGLFEDGLESEINFNSINAMINIDNQISDEFSIVDYFTTKEHSSPSYIYASSTPFLNSYSLENIISIIKQKTRPLISQCGLTNLLKTTTFDLEKIAQEKTAIFVITNDLDTNSNVIASLLIDQVFRVLTNRPNPTKFNFILDNYQTLNPVNNLDNMLSIAPSQKIKFTLITRNIKSIEKRIGKEIYSLSDLVEVKLNLLIITLDRETSKINVNLVPKESSSEPIIYPHLPESPIKIFNLKEFFLKPKTNLQDKLTTNRSPENFPIFDNRLDELIKRIDEKIAELEIEDLEIEESTKDLEGKYKIYFQKNTQIQINNYVRLEIIDFDKFYEQICLDKAKKVKNFSYSYQYKLVIRNESYLGTFKFSSQNGIEDTFDNRCNYRVYMSSWSLKNKTNPYVEFEIKQKN